MRSTESITSRETVNLYGVTTEIRRPIVVTIGPGDMLHFRQADEREGYRLPIDAAFRQAIITDTLPLFQMAPTAAELDPVMPKVQIVRSPSFAQPGAHPHYTWEICEPGHKWQGLQFITPLQISGSLLNLCTRAAIRAAEQDAQRKSA